MGLNEIKPGLRALHYDSNQVAKVQINVQPGDVLHVSDDLADQLQRADTHFKPIGDDGQDSNNKGVESAGSDDSESSDSNGEPEAKPARRRKA